MTTNQIKLREVVEDERSNQAKEAETHRSNLEKEKLQAQEIRTKEEANKIAGVNVGANYIKAIGKAFIPFL